MSKSWCKNGPACLFRLHLYKHSLDYKCIKHVNSLIMVFFSWLSISVKSTHYHETCLLWKIKFLNEYCKYTYLNMIEHTTELKDVFKTQLFLLKSTLSSTRRGTFYMSIVIFQISIYIFRNISCIIYPEIYYTFWMWQHFFLL